MKFVARYFSKIFDWSKYDTYWLFNQCMSHWFVHIVNVVHTQHQGMLQRITRNTAIPNILVLIESFISLRNLRKLLAPCFISAAGSPRLLIKHFVLIRPDSTLQQGWPGIMPKCLTSQWAAAPSCIAIIPHQRSSQGPGTKSKESILSRTKLFNTVIAYIFFSFLYPVTLGKWNAGRVGELSWALFCIPMRNLGYPSWTSLF